MQQPERMGREPVLKLIVSFALPSIAGMLAGSLYNIVDRMFVGRIVGPEGLAAISVCFPFMLLLLSLCLLFGIGAVPLISQALGEGDRKRAERALGNVVSSVAVIGTLFMIAGMGGMDFLLRLSGADDALLPLAREYMRIILMAVPVGMLAFALNFCVRAEGRPLFAMGTQVVGAVSNILLDALFIWGWGWGVAGAAWGTIISQMVSLLWVSSFYGQGRGCLRIRLRSLRPRLEILKRILALGLSPCLTELSFSLFFVLFNRSMNAYGGPIAVSALGAFLGWDSMLFLPVLGIGEAVQTLFGYNWGARLPGRVLETLKWALILAAGYFVGSALGVYIFVEEMMRFFTTDPALLVLASEGMIIAYSGVVFSGITLIANSFFQGLGRAKLSLLLSLTRQLLMLIPAIFILPRFWGVKGVWACFPVLDMGGGILAFFLLLRYYRILRFDRCESGGTNLENSHWERGSVPEEVAER